METTSFKSESLGEAGDALGHPCSSPASGLRRDYTKRIIFDWMVILAVISQSCFQIVGVRGFDFTLYRTRSGSKHTSTDSTLYHPSAFKKPRISDPTLKEIQFPSNAGLPSGNKGINSTSWIFGDESSHQSLKYLRRMKQSCNTSSTNSSATVKLADVEKAKTGYRANVDKTKRETLRKSDSSSELNLPYIPRPPMQPLKGIYLLALLPFAGYACPIWLLRFLLGWGIFSMTTSMSDRLLDRQFNSEATTAAKAWMADYELHLRKKRSNAAQKSRPQTTLGKMRTNVAM